MAITGFSIFTLIVFFGVSESRQDPLLHVSRCSRRQRSSSLTHKSILSHLTDILVVFPFDIPIPFFLSRPIRKTLESLRILNPIPPPPRPIHGKPSSPPPSTPNTETTPNANPTSKLNPNTYTNDTETSNGENATDDVGQPAFSTSHNGKEEQQRWIFHMDLTTAPVIGVLLLLATTSIGGDVLRNGIVGTNGVKPYDIMTLFLSLVSEGLELSLLLIRRKTSEIFEQGETADSYITYVHVPRPTYPSLSIVPVCFVISHSPSLSKEVDPVLVFISSSTSSSSSLVLL